MKSFRLKFLILAFLSIFLVEQAYAQTSDTLFHPYHVNGWVSGSIMVVGLTANALGIPLVMNKAVITQVELDALNKNVINNIDRTSLHQDPSQMKTYENYSTYSIPIMVLLPSLLLFDKQIRNDWVDVLLMYMETMSITPNIYEWSPLGPTFQNRFRPVTYYTQLTTDRTSGNNRNSFYSGHVATVSASTFFMVKVYSDFNPQIGANKYLLYGAATIPPLILGYFRVKALKHFPSDVLVGMGVGALCGIIIPEFHRLDDKGIKLGMFSSPEATGITLAWQPGFLK